MKCNKCGATYVGKGDSKKLPTKRVGPDQDGMLYRVDCTTNECPFKEVRLLKSQ